LQARGVKAVSILDEIDGICKSIRTKREGAGEGSDLSIFSAACRASQT
jgi:hypothetical protein